MLICRKVIPRDARCYIRLTARVPRPLLAEESHPLTGGSRPKESGGLRCSNGYRN